MEKLRISVTSYLSCFVMIIMLAGATSCANTAKGMKKDTQNNKQKTGQAVEKAGEDMQK
jgi:hypothetical protein